MQQIQQQTTGSGYTSAATLEGVWNSPGGYYSIIGGSAYMELQYVPPGQGLGGDTWTNEVLVPVGNGNLTQGTTGVRFRDAGSAGGPAVVTAALSAEAEPLIIVGAPGSITTTPGAAGLIAGQVNADGSIAIGATLFSVVKGGNGIYTVTFTSPYATPPAVALGSAGAATAIDLSALPTAAGFGVRIFISSSNVATDSPWAFLSSV